MSFHRYTPWNVPEQFSHIFDLIYVRVERAREIAAFYRYSRQNGLYIQLVRSYPKSVYVFFAVVLSTKVIVYVCHDRLAVFTKLSKRSDHSSFFLDSMKSGPKSMIKPWTHISRENNFSTAEAGENAQICVLTHILRWICVSYGGPFWPKSPNQQSTWIIESNFNVTAIFRRCWVSPEKRYVKKSYV